MNKILLFIAAATFSFSSGLTQDFDIEEVKVQKNEKLQQLVFSITVAGLAGNTTPTPAGMLDGAPVLGYVFPTSLTSTDVGFDSTEGIVALALTSHPDFDDTPLWDENWDGRYDNDGIVWHPHWVLLESNSNVPGGLAVKATDSTSVLPPTNPGMPMYMDSPGYPVIWDGKTITCTVPLYRMNQQVDFMYDGVTALMNVNTSDPMRPMLGVYQVYSVASGDLSLPYSVGNHTCDTLIIDVSSSSIGLLDPSFAKIYPNPASEEVRISLSPNFDLGLYKVEIHASSGSLNYQANLNSLDISIPVSSIGSPGLYIISIVDTRTNTSIGSKQLLLNR